MDMHVHEGHLVFAEKVGSDGDVTRKKVRLVMKGYTEVGRGLLAHLLTHTRP